MMERLRHAAVLGLLLVACAPEPPTGAEVDGESWLGAGEAVAPWHPSVRRARRAVFDGDPTSADPDTLALRLFDDTVVVAERLGLRQGALGSSWVGSILDGEPAVTGVVLSTVGGMPAGTVRTEEGLFQILPDGENEVLVIDRDEAAIEPEGPIAAPALAPADAPASPAPSAPAPTGDAGTEVDLLVLYTPEALDGVGSSDAMEAVIELAVAETNLGYEASGVDVALRVVHTAQTAYDESGFDWSQTLSRLRGTSDGYMDEIHALRDAHGADHVVLLVDTVGPYAGIGYQLVNGVAPFFDAWAFSVVARDYATGAYTFGHELGHNMGANHDHDNAQGPGYHAYSHGLQVPTHGYRTIMAYSCGGCARINYWSNPAVSVAGAPTGVVDWADNARTLNHTAPLTAQFREAAATLLPATLATPDDGSILPATTATFAWADTGAASYRLQIGTPGDPSRYHDAEVGAQTSVFVAGLPHDGSSVVAHLSSALPSGWVTKEASYLAYSAPAGSAKITYPLDGTTLPAGEVDVRWSYDGEAIEHHLVIFDAAGHEVASVQTPSQAATVELPCGADKLHLTLYTQGQDGWAETAASYPSAVCP